MISLNHVIVVDRIESFSIGTNISKDVKSKILEDQSSKEFCDLHINLIFKEYVKVL